MEQTLAKNISQCQSALDKNGFFISKLILPDKLITLVQEENYSAIDELFFDYTNSEGFLFRYLQSFCELKSIEFIISLREAKNEWEEDGIWHDDGSRLLAFSLSLTTEKPEGGILEIKKKGDSHSTSIPTPHFGEVIVFKTGIDGYEHKINQVTKGKRLIIAGWCT